MSTGLIIGIIVGVIALIGIIFAFWWFGTFNTLVRLRNNNEEAFSTMDVYMKKRYDLIPNIVETVKGYAKHERETLEAVISARNAARSADTVSGKLQAEKAFAGQYRRFMMLAESYPDLKANTNFMDLQNQLKTIESEIASSRKYYNACVKAYNTKTETFPSSIVARAKKFEKAPLFVVDDVEERKAVKVSF